jgi:hypothetical protein
MYCYIRKMYKNEYFYFLNYFQLNCFYFFLTRPGLVPALNRTDSGSTRQTRPDLKNMTAATLSNIRFELAN